MDFLSLQGFDGAGAVGLQCFRGYDPCRLPFARSRPYLVEQAIAHHERVGLQSLTVSMARVDAYPLVYRVQIYHQIVYGRGVADERCFACQR